MGVYLPTRHGGRARAGFLETFEHYPVNGALRRPWVHIGDGAPGSFVRDSEGNGELMVTNNSGTVNGGGESYEYMPFTPNWGFEIRLWMPVSGVLAQSFSIYLTNSWKDIGAAFTNVVGIRLLHAPASGGETVQIAQFANTFDTADVRGMVTSPVAFNGQYLRLKIWVDDDWMIRVWLNDNYLGFALTTLDYKFGPGRRCARFLNTCLNAVWITEMYHYDRPGDFPDASMFNAVEFYDDFNRANGAVGNGWTTYGSGTSITNNSWGVSEGSPSDGSKGILRPSTVTNGKLRIEGVVGGRNGIAASQDSQILFCVNDAGTAGLSANFFAGKLYIARWTGSVTSPSYTNLSFNEESIQINNGDTVAINLNAGNAWIEQNGQRRLYATNVHDVVPASNNKWGSRVNRGSFVNSNSWNSLKMLKVA